MSSSPQPAPEFHVEIQPSPFVQPITSASPGITVGEGTHYIGFSPPLDRARIQVGSVYAVGNRP